MFKSTLQVIISGIDKFSPTVGKIIKTTELMQNRLSKVGRGFATSGGILAGGGIGIAHALGLTSLPGQLVKAERSLVQLGNIGELTAGQMKLIGDEMFRLQGLTNQTQGNLYEGINTLVAAGMDPTKALDLMNPIGRASKAEDADIKDLAIASFTAYDNLKVPINRVSDALNIMTLAGKRGRFELKNMAKEFPALTASAGVLNLGKQKDIKGADGTIMGGGLRSVSQIAAGLQIALKGAGDPSQAATNMSNFYQKIFSGQTMRNMKKINGDPLTLIKLWGKSLKDGLDPMEQTLIYLDKLTNVKGLDKVFGMTQDQMLEAGGYKSAAIGAIFEDKQVQDFVKIMMPNLREYSEMRDEWMKKPLVGKDIVGGDFVNVMKTTSEQFDKLKIGLAMGFAPNLEGPLMKANSLLTKINSSATLTKTLLYGIGTAIIGGGILVGLGTIAFSLSSIVGLFGATAATATLLSTVVSGIGSALVAGLPVILGAAFGTLAVLITDAITKGVLGYKVGLGDIIMNGGYAKAVEEESIKEFEQSIRTTNPGWSEEKIQRLVADRRKRNDVVDHSTPTNYIGEPSMGFGAGAYQFSQFYQKRQKEKAEVVVRLENFPSDAKVKVNNFTGVNLDTYRGPYRQ